MSKPVILCVDDEKAVLQSLRTQLMEAFGNDYAYEAAEDADEALEVIHELSEEDMSIILIVSDWLMPGMKGDEFLIRVHQQFPNVIKILLTGQADELAIQRAKDHANLHCCLFKPWSEAELIETLKSGLEQLQ
ncbi:MULTISPECIES: response regulator [unclassified Coleofasciculus]|uniref:response regulator n=1 Tax=unclassified Coleofasciculus TaxID=2692782 RepID=UPI0018813E9E|nr:MULTISPECIES: response regulator [unclassified Coleofasciculus]MBE9128248.1 response regulator [Coleofasciculus sp. LEGE 07081]MBE9148570.1 response regulator [Coleofasciculus sp. LEGE 07092]